MSSSRRCSICAEEWPNKERYKTCPTCGEKTWIHKDTEPTRDTPDSDTHESDLPDKEPTTKRTGEKRAKDEIQLFQFRQWLDTVTADDFAATL